MQAEESKTSKRLRVLVVDDEPDVREIFRLALSHKGFEVTPVESGQAALEEIAKAPYDLVFLDIAMPGMDGVATLKEIKNIAPDAPVIMITAFMDHALDPDDRNDRVADAMALGARGCLRKPFGMSTIIKTAEYFAQ